MPEASIQLGAEALGDWLVNQRWFASKSRSVSEFNVLELVPLDPGFVL